MKKHSSRLLALALCACLVLSMGVQAAEKPAGPVTRGEFIEALYRAHISRNGHPGTVLSDAWAESMGVIKGYEDGQLHLERQITRLQMAVMLYRYTSFLSQDNALPNLNYPPVDELAPYADAGSVPDWAKDAARWALRRNVWFSGSGDHLYPHQTVDQGEVGIALMTMNAGGAALATRWEGYNTDPEIRLVLAEGVGAQLAGFTIINDSTDYLFQIDECGIFRKINGGWYSLDQLMMVGALDLIGRFPLHQIFGSAQGITARFPQNPGESRYYEQPYLNNVLANLPAGEYRVVQNVWRGVGLYTPVTYRTEVLLFADFTIG